VKDSQSILLVLAGAALGFLTGTYLEHRRLLSELKGLHAAHRETHNTGESA
jgi:hypothetical protein